VKPLAGQPSDGRLLVANTLTYYHTEISTSVKSFHPSLIFVDMGRCGVHLSLKILD